MAQRTLLQLTEHGSQTCPAASNILQHQIYVDDIFIGADSTLQAVDHRDQLIQLLATAGMRLGKWASNKPEMLEGLPSADIVQMPVNSGETVSILGLSWCPGSDTLTFQASSPPVTGTVSKRVILSHIAKLFDPLGFLSHVLIKAKILLQDLWLNKQDWDTPLNDDLLERWLDFHQSLPMVAEIQLP